ncbi:hypothetical protein CCOS865_05105 [Pseudomonas reidholzensis]|uniref:Uncharacterized protein n=1 Tax=Pseudomonas reidholzensis TaxID=1785162 RepID=A0A383S1C5_9PSED|nr:hypothetical protein [Pseudomonas reidholzensis]SYX92813.1 hypothetical protein CCOS865_05105 [Pseudomonas reidholzensis]
MDTAALKHFLEEKIDAAAKQIQDKKKADLDHLAYGQLSYLMSLRRLVEGTHTKEDLGLHDAINDVLEELGVIGLLQQSGKLKKAESYLKLITPSPTDQPRTLPNPG